MSVNVFSDIQKCLHGVAPVHLVEAPPNTSPPFLVAAPSLSERTRDTGTMDPATATAWRLTCTAGTPAGALILAQLARAALAGPGQERALTDTRAALTWERTLVVAVDRDITIPGTQRHPAYVVEEYRVTG